MRATPAPKCPSSVPLLRSMSKPESPGTVPGAAVDSVLRFCWHRFQTGAARTKSWRVLDARTCARRLHEPSPLWLVCNPGRRAPQPGGDRAKCTRNACVTGAGSVRSVGLSNLHRGGLEFLSPAVCSAALRRPTALQPLATGGEDCMSLWVLAALSSVLEAPAPRHAPHWRDQIRQMGRTKLTPKVNAHARNRGVRLCASAREEGDDCT